MSYHPQQRRLVIHSNAERAKTRAAHNTPPPRKRLVGWKQYLSMAGKR